MELRGKGVERCEEAVVRIDEVPHATHLDGTNWSLFGWKEMHCFGLRALAMARTCFG